MKRLKKAALAVACAAVLCSVFSGCGGDKKDTAKAAPAEEKVLTVYTARSENLNNLVIPAFEKETGIKVWRLKRTIPRAIFSGRLTRRCWIPRKNFLRNMYLRKMRI